MAYCHGLTSFSTLSHRCTALGTAGRHLAGHHAGTKAQQLVNFNVEARAVLRTGAGGNRHTKGAAAAIAILVCFAVATYVGLGVLYWRRRQAARADAAFRDDRDGYAAIPLASAGNGDHETPL